MQVRALMTWLFLGRSNDHLRSADVAALLLPFIALRFRYSLPKGNCFFGIVRYLQDRSGSVMPSFQACASYTRSLLGTFACFSNGSHSLRRCRGWK